MKIFSIILPIVLLMGCATGFQKFYKPYVDARTLQDVELLNEGEYPKIVIATDMKSDVKRLISKGYRPIGESSFNGELESEKGVINQAKENGAKLVLVSSKYTETRTINTPLILPNNQTTYSSGSIYGSGGSANYYGSSTTYGTTVVPLTTNQQRYDQNAVYFVKSTKKPKFGIMPIDLPPELRIKLERNTGALIDIIFEESPAFIANLLPGDVIIEINGTPIVNAKQAIETMQAQMPDDGKCPIKIIRSGIEKSVTLQLNHT
jgi:serine protease Do